MMVSIIVPVFNVEKYIEECIQSVVNQTYQDWEMLLLNDGSTDMSGMICDRYTKNDDRIKVVHKVNTGVSDTRNHGLDIAKGEYVIFLDSDDYWYEDTALAQLVAAAEYYHLDIVRGEYKAIDSNGLDLFERPFTKTKLNYSSKILSPGIFYTKILCGENFLVLSLIRREALGSLRFNKNRDFLEDMELYAYLLLQQLRCMFLPIRFYAYRKLSSSASHTPKVKNLFDSFSMCNVFNECIKNTSDEVLRKSFRYNSIMMYYWTLDTMSQDSYYSNRSNLIKQLSLLKLNKQVRIWAYLSKKIYPLPIYISPLLGIYYFRLKHKIGVLKRKIKKNESDE